MAVHTDSVWPEMVDEILEDVHHVRGDIMEGGILGETKVRRAGRILDISKDGYYNSEMVAEDFVQVCF